MVYSITDDTTFSKLDRVRDEIMRAQRGRPNVPIFLVGTKKDLDSDRAVSDKERLAKARQWGPTCKTFEISSRTNDGVDDCFEALVLAILNTSTDPSKGGGGSGGVMGAGKSAAINTGEPEMFKPKRCGFM